MSFLFDLIYEWVIYGVPTWLWWVLMTPLLCILILFAADRLLSY